ncbi:multiubiquitin domain-containing protein [Burkholderia pyrrocinia]|uniref:multiubiquitin domain-containing protein n=1 Tax=Burkholderia pyrrocinia TaxID=60550 RepID=UPI001576F845|nr:multiubiquitin domain-containing protein [Burkholderia pyrrocinia]NTX31228.1 multiubiquitin domain-containing protein [Burkholderia pyrrocinia]
METQQNFDGTDERSINRPKRIEIVVNGREAEVDDRNVTFEQLVAIAYPGEPPMPNIKYSITYRGVVSKPHSGELAAGGSVEVKMGSIFNVGRTVQS